jgi:hypothetical protein
MEQLNVHGWSQKLIALRNKVKTMFHINEANLVCFYVRF